MLLIEALE